MSGMADKILAEENKVKRHGFHARFVHWTVAVSTLLLIFTGIGQMPMYKRYMVDQLPALGWTSNYSITLAIHYWAAAALVLAVVYHLVFHGLRRDFDILPRRGDIRESIRIIMAMLGRGEEPESDKYLAEQRLAYAFIGFSLLLVILTGVIKVLKNLPRFDFPEGVIFWATNLHNLGMFLIMIGIAAHFGAFLFKDNRRLLPGMFTGKVDLDYARRRHGLWCDRMEKKGADDHGR